MKFLPLRGQLPHKEAAVDSGVDYGPNMGMRWLRGGRRGDGDYGVMKAKEDGFRKLLLVEPPVQYRGSLGILRDVFC